MAAASIVCSHLQQVSLAAGPLTCK